MASSLIMMYFLTSGLANGRIFQIPCSNSEGEGLPDFVYSQEHVAKAYNVETTTETFKWLKLRLILIILLWEYETY